MKNLRGLQCKFYLDQSERKSTQVHTRSGQTESQGQSQVDPGFQVVSTCDSVRLARALCMNTRTAITEETTKMYNSNSAGCSAYLLLAGSLLILLGNTASLKSCKIDCHHFSSQSGVNAKTSSLKTQIAKNPRLCSGQNSTQIEMS